MAWYEKSRRTKWPIRTLGVADLKKALDAGMTVIDACPKNEFAKGFIPGTLNIQGTNKFNTWIG